MKQGLEYAFSKEKRLFDTVAASTITLPAFASRILTGHLLRGQPGEDSNPIFRQERPGANNVPFVIHKLRTLNSETLEPISGLTHFLRRYGIDELVQVRNIWDDKMSVVAHRPIPQHEQEAVFDNAPGRLVDQWRQIVEPTKPGWLSTFSILNHQEPERMFERAELKLECDLRDTINGSLAYDIALIGRAFCAAARGET